MKCGRCGGENPRGAKRCIHCNATFAYKSANVPNRPMQGRPVQRVQNGRPIQENVQRRQPVPVQKKGGMWAKFTTGEKSIFISIISLVLILAMLAGIYTYRSCDSSGGGFSGGGGGGGGTIAPYTPDFDNNNPQAVMDNIKEANGGTMPEITYDDEEIPQFIDGKFTKQTVTDTASAIRSLVDVKGLMKMENPTAEYQGIDTLEGDAGKIHRLQQIVGGIPVYGKQMIVAADNNGAVKALIGDYDSGLSQISTTPTITKEKAIEIAKQQIGSQEATVDACDLYIYSIKESNYLAWVIVCNQQNDGKQYVISATDGAIIDIFSVMKATSVTANRTDANGKTRTINADYSNGQYELKDLDRDIWVHDCNNTSYANMVTSTNNTWSPEAVTAMANARDVYDCYNNVFGTRVFIDGRLNRINIFFNYQEGKLFKTSNAFSSTSSGNNKSTLIRIGNGDDYIKALDVFAHEFTHAVTDSTIPDGLLYLNQSGAIHEAYADIMGNIIQNHLYGTDFWEHGEEKKSGASRSIVNPNKYRQPDKVGGKYMAKYCTKNHSHEEAGCDNGGVHTNSGIINKAAYYMYSTEIRDLRELGTLFVKSLDYMTSTTDFLNCRNALICAARDMGMNQNKINAIKTAFTLVGIEEGAENVTNPDEDDTGIVLTNGTLSGKVAKATDSTPIVGVEIVAENADRRGVAHSDDEGKFSVKLKAGTYNLTVNAAGYLSCTVNDVVVEANKTTTLENTILLEEKHAGTVSQVGGKITNAVSGDAVEGATVRFRKNHGVKSGELVHNDAGRAITATSDSDGKYYVASLDAGYYTMEVSKQGYVTQFVNVIAADQSSGALDQNVVLSPNASGTDFRITLEWEAHPRDEDAHIVGDKPGQFHVYYKSKNAKINGKTVANLDHDDRFGNGFETITLSAESDGKYKYYVHHFAGEKSLSVSNAKVKVYRGGVLVKQYNVPVDQGTGRYWNVFKIEGGKVIDVQTITDQPQ